VVVLSLVSLSQDAASELLYPVLPLLLTGVLGAPAVVVGLVEGVAEGAAALTKYLAGTFSDRWRRRPLVFLGYGLAAVGKVVVAMATVWPMVLVGRVTDRVGKGVRGAPRDALLAEDASERQLGRVFGFHRAMDTLGAVIGPLLGLAVLAVTDGNVRVALWVAVVPAVVSVVLVAFTRERRVASHESRSEPSPEASSEPASEPAARQRRARLPQDLRVVIALLTVIALVNFPDALVLLRVSQTGFDATGVVAVYVLYNLVYAAASLPAGMLADRLPRARVYAVGLACFAVGYTGLGLVSGGWAVVVLMTVYGGFNAFTDGVGKAWVSALVRPESRGRAQGVFQGLGGGAVLLAGLWAGLLWDVGAGSGAVPLVVAGLAGAVAAVVMWAIGSRLG
jgi:MFS family permease